MAIDSSRAGTTPPHHPNFGVELSETTLASIMRAALPDPNHSWTFSRLPSGQSYNNRIYTVADSNVRRYILKVNGRFFGSKKIENEVSCLLISQHFCPQTPVPRVIAWSTDGTIISRCDNTKAVPDGIEGLANIPGWILMTRLPGKVLDPASLSKEQWSALGGQLAQVILSWRRDIPSSKFAGNFNFCPNTSTPFINHQYYPAQATLLGNTYLYGLIGIGKGVAPPMQNLLEFWKSKLECLMEELETEPGFEALRDAVLPILREFIQNTLPRMSLFHHRMSTKPFVFSHTDLAPRNILISDDEQPTITGIVDFEFSGFLPSTEEFLQEYVRREPREPRDWPWDMYSRLLGDLERSGEITPLGIDGTEAWEDLYALDRLETNISPWWMSAADVEGLAKASAKVQDLIATLAEKYPQS